VPAPWEEYDGLSWEKTNEYFEENRRANEEAARKLGYKGEHTGKLVREGVADGYAAYMVMDNGKTFSLMHMDWMDGYHFPWAKNWTKADIKVMITRREAIGRNTSTKRGKICKSTRRTGR
jgi:hypothetical protein